MLSTNEIFSKDLFFLNWDVNSPEEVFSRLEEALSARAYIRKGWMDAILMREDKYPTGISIPSGDIAIPHTDPEYIEHQYIAVVRPRKPVDFRLMDGFEDASHAQLIFNLGISSESDQVEILQSLMKMLLNQNAAQSIFSQTSVDGLYRAIRDAF